MVTSKQIPYNGAEQVLIYIDKLPLNQSLGCKENSEQVLDKDAEQTSILPSRHINKHQIKVPNVYKHIYIGSRCETFLFAPPLVIFLWL